MIDLSKALRYIRAIKPSSFFPGRALFDHLWSSSAYGNPDMKDWGNPALRFRYEDMLKE